MPIFPRRLNGQLILLVSSILLLTGATSGWLNARKQSDMLLASMRGNAAVMVSNLGGTCVHYLVLREYAGLEAFLLKAAELPDVLRLQVCEPDGAVVADVERAPGAKPRAMQGLSRLAVPAPQLPLTLAGDGGLVIWQPVKAGGMLGWIKATYSMAAIRQAQAETWKRSLLLALFWVACSVVLLLLMLRPAVRAIGRISLFARGLAGHKGDTLEVVSRTAELAELSASLNYASGSLFSAEQERKRTEEDLRRTNELLELVFSASHTMIAYMDREFNFIRVNDAYAAADGRKPGEYPGKNHFALYPDAENEAIFRAVVRTGKPSIVLEKAVEYAGHPERGVSYWDWTLQPVKGADGTVEGLVLILQDVTARKCASLDREKLEQQLRQAQKMEAVGTLAGGVAHDFNNILTAIIGYASIMKRKMPPGDPHHASIDQILASSDRAARLTRGLLAFSRKQIINPKPVDLNDIVRSVERLLQRLIGEDVELSAGLAPGPLIVMADAGQVEQVLMNLATNARDAMPEGGLLTITTGKIELGEDFVSLHGYGAPGQYALVTVSDTGQGMDEQTRQKIFEPFFTTKELGKGTGLGLAIVYGIVKQHDGIINVYSEPGRGTTFKIYLPLAGAAAERPETEAPAQPARGTETILFAEDDKDVRAMTSAVLREFGYRVVEAVDGQDALEKYAVLAGEIEFLLLDVIMPRKSGKDVYEAVRAARPDIKTLFISGYTADVIHRKGIFEEGLQFISKPVSPFELLGKIREMLDEKR